MFTKLITFLNIQLNCILSTLFHFSSSGRTGTYRYTPVLHHYSTAYSVFDHFQFMSSHGSTSFIHASTVQVQFYLLYHIYRCQWYYNSIVHTSLCTHLLLYCYIVLLPLLACILVFYRYFISWMTILMYYIAGL